MIVTVTLNPSLDRTLEIDSLEPGGVMRTGAPRLEAGGKGVNVTRALAVNHVPSVAVLPLGGGEGADMIRLLELDGIVARVVPIAGRTRSNITIAEADGTVTKLNEPGPELGIDDVAAIAAAITAAAGAGDWLVFSGSMPPHCTEAALATLLDAAAETGAHLAVDTSGPALHSCVKARPRLVKPNREELSELVGEPLDCLSDVVSAAERVRAQGVERVLVSLGSDGAVLVGPSGVLVGESRVDFARSTVGAGDCFLAGFLARFSRDEADEPAALLEALAWGAAAATLPGSAVPGPDDLDYTNVQLVRQPDLDRPLVAG
ncbi:1-phosphofructokinase [Desertivibrio insolitus]|uniref:1-phosphofructokinase n=1 Tax=Herbiconiux sp. SYSU D00978 TaxID=2812562 RepID=UPI001A97C5D6|nr:1-phosphofructokinase [Herbiconiux sp. SYSU D00978]